MKYKTKMFHNKEYKELVWYKHYNGSEEARSSTILGEEWHRLDGPAYKTRTNYGYNIEYWEHNVQHCFHGPAAMYIALPGRYTSLTNGWYIRGKGIDGNTYQQWLLDQGMDIKNLTDVDKVLIEMRWGPQ